MFKLYIFDEVNQDYKSQVTDINNKVKQYKQKLDEYQKTLNSDQINPNLIRQELILGNEIDANISYKTLRGDIKVTYDNEKDITAMKDSKTSIVIDTDNTGNLTGNIIEVTYSNLNKSSYKGRKISKIVATYSNAIRDKLALDNVRLRIMSNPFEGFWYWQTSAVNVEYKYYDINGNLINFDNDDQSWITVGSLNSGQWRTESAQLLSNGKTYSFKGSTVSVHNGNELYSDGVNEYGESGDPVLGAPNGLGNSFIRNLSFDERSWDTGLDSPLAYKGAGVFKITGNNLNIVYKTLRITKMQNSKTWATISTTIPKGSGPVAPEIHYRLDSELLCTLFYILFIFKLYF